MFIQSLDDTPIQLKKERKLYVLYTAMQIHLKNSDRKNKRNDLALLRNHLQKQLIISPDDFMREAKKVLHPRITLSENYRLKQQFNDLILSNSSIALNSMKNSLYSFLYALCYIRAENALGMFVEKHPRAIHLLSTEKFNSICVAAASNHLFDFMNYLCKQDKSIDEYSIEPYGDGSVWTCIQTPFVAACLRIHMGVIKLYPIHYNAERIAKALQVLELLVAKNANPNNRYICDDLSPRALVECLRNGNGYTILDIMTGTNRYKDILVSNALEIFVPFYKYLHSLKGESSELNHPPIATFQ